MKRTMTSGEVLALVQSRCLHSGIHMTGDHDLPVPRQPMRPCSCDPGVKSVGNEGGAVVALAVSVVIGVSCVPQKGLHAWGEDCVLRIGKGVPGDVV